MLDVAKIGINALYEEFEFFSEVEREKCHTQAVLALYEAVAPVRQILQRANREGDEAVKNNAARIIRRIRDEMHYRKEIISHTYFKEGLELFFGVEKRNEIYVHHFQQVEKQRKEWKLTLEEGDGKAITQSVKSHEKNNQLKCLTDSELFITIIRGTPDILEASDMCRRALHDLKRVQLEATTDGDAKLAKQCVATADRIKENIHVLSQINQNSSINYSIRVLLNKEEKVKLYSWLNSQSDYALIDKLQNIAFNGARIKEYEPEK
jgi:hypothetical protein